MADATAAAHAVEEHDYSATGVPTRKVGFWTFIGSECLFFGSLIATYMVYKGASVQGPLPHEILNIPLTTVSTFVLLMSSLAMVLAPLRLHACYGWPSCDAATAARAVVLYVDGKPRVDDHQGKPPACGITPARDGSCDLSQWRAGTSSNVFGPQGGLRISANGLAKIGRLLLGDGEVDGVRLLEPASVAAMIGPEWSFDGSDGLTLEEDDPIRTRGGFTYRYGLAVHTLATGLPGCGDDPFGDGVPRIGHSGNAYGLLAGLWLDRAAGTGVVYFTTGNDAPAPGVRSAFSAVEERSARGAAVHALLSIIWITGAANRDEVEGTVSHEQRDRADEEATDSIVGENADQLDAAEPGDDTGSPTVENEAADEPAPAAEPTEAN